MFQAMLEVMLSYFEKGLKVMLETKSPGGICIDSMKQLCIDIISNQQYVEVSLWKTKEVHKSSRVQSMMMWLMFWKLSKGSA